MVPRHSKQLSQIFNFVPNVTNSSTKKSQVAAITALKAELDGQRQQVMLKDARILDLEKTNAELVCAFHSCVTCAVWPRHAVLQTEGKDAEMV